MTTALSPAVHQEQNAKLVREIVTPEGVPIRFTLATAGDRAAAFILDIVIQLAILFAFGLTVGLTAGGGGSWLTPVLIILSFLLLNFYFVFFEVRWQGSTPGKRKTGIRVIDARGGQLETSAVLARNLVRELEVWTPARLLIANRMLWPDAPGWAIVLAILWALLFMLMPLFNKDKLRIGDLIAGTRVVVQPKTVLLPDLVDEAVAAKAFTFTDAQLAVYGIYELQVLEGLLRQSPANKGFEDSVRTVAEKIREKVAYTGTVADDERFLRDFYAALRAHLEQRMLFGQRRQDKYAKR